ncbi:hypothetical protein NQ315_014282 [Exocentrus adspersus]|uniref:Reverse transcriptase n=1 Tax=Exocentrus adspersus TaxID=1586481 RepID=A0AAV8VIF7_9CUCU|nr:hypothetical protein NQ315_014282 [Exocentrus adspersus]
MYVDDLVSGSNSVDEALNLQKQVIGLLNRDDQTSLSFDVDTFVKIQGLQWQPSLDVFSYHVALMDRTCTKRTILSELARIFDPLGFLSPVTIFLKLLVQKLWTLGIRLG